jgi:NTE family protein
MGAEIIIASDLISKHKYEEPDGIIEILLNSFHMALIHIARLQASRADILITPDLSDYDLVNVNNVPEMLEIGYREAMRILDN